MRFLKGYAAGFAALLLVLAIILSSLVPEHGTYVMTVGALGLILLVAGLVLNRDRVVGVLRGKKARAAGASAGYALTVIAVLVLVNFLAIRHHKRYDLTESQEFSLSEQTIKVVESLPREVTVTAFYREAEPTKQKLEDLLAEYQYHSRKLSVHYIDPDTHPGDAKRYSITEYGTIVVESGKNESRVNTPDDGVRMGRWNEMVPCATARPGRRSGRAHPNHPARPRTKYFMVLPSSTRCQSEIRRLPSPCHPTTLV